MPGIGLGLGLGQFSGGGGSAYVGLLDTYPNAAAGYSVRLLSSAYSGSAIRVRRSSDNAEQDIGFVNNELDTSSLTTFCGAGNGFVTTWYDQSGNGNNVTQSTAANQPQIVNGGSVITQGGKPSVQSSGSKILTKSGSGTSTDNSLMIVYKANTLGAYNTIACIGDINGTRPLNLMLSNSVGNLRIIYDEQGTISQDGTNTTNYELCSIFSSTNNVQMNINSIAQTLTNNTKTITANQSNIQLFADSRYGDHYIGLISELIYYASNKSTDKTGIESNINSYYGIY
mgnify:CR=1 FL=1